MAVAIEEGTAGAPDAGHGTRALAEPVDRRRVFAWNRYRFWEKATPFLFVAPVIAIVGVFTYWPLIYSIWLSFFDWNFVSPVKEFVGFANFTRLVDDPRFHRALWGTLVYILALVPAQVLLPLGLALLLWPIRRSRAQAVYRVTLFSPTVISFSVAALLWLWIFNPLQGILNKVIFEFGFAKVSWLSNPNTAIWCVIVVSIWKTIGFNLLLYLAALEAVPNDYIEAASLDGASGWQMFRLIRFPLITPTFFFVLVTTIISVNDEVFGAINVMTDGGPFDRSSNIVYYLYEQGFRIFQIGSASAVSLLIFAGTAILTWVQFRFVERHVHYG
ncbi:MAG TPA: sugar ABC transporter permease [Casimicrobiaceae bacterium]|nr:sugar ABC transporter permease [Casimicrobiaceae bacterium]